MVTGLARLAGLAVYILKKKRKNGRGREKEKE